jgi:broad specificity phosphatase PhoE
MTGSTSISDVHQMPERLEVRVLLVRHGQTALNAEGRLRGLADPELDDTGIAQAHATAQALQPLRLRRVCSSPLRRAVTTAQIIAQASGVGSDVDSAFNDRDYGPWTGHVKTEVIQQWGSVDAAPGVETAAIVLTRAMHALNAIAQVAGVDGPIAAVTHDAVIRPILASIQPGIDPIVETGSWAELAHTNDGWTVLSFDNTAPNPRASA